MDKRTFLEPEQRRAWVTVIFILVFGVLDILPSHRILKFNGNHWQAVDGQHHIDALIGAGTKLDLAGYAQNVLLVGSNRLGIHAAGGLKGGEGKSLAEAFEPVAQHMKHTLGGELLDQPIKQNAFGSITLQVEQRLPLLGLG